MSIFVLQSGGQYLFARNKPDVTASDWQAYSVIELISIASQAEVRKVLETEFFYRPVDSLLKERRPYFVLKIN